MNVKQSAARDIVTIWTSIFVQFQEMRYDEFIGSVVAIRGFNSLHALLRRTSGFHAFHDSCHQPSLTLEYFSSRFRGWPFVNVRIMSCSLDKWESNEFRLESNEWPLKKRDLSNEYAPGEYISTNEEWRWRVLGVENRSKFIPIQLKPTIFVENSSLSLSSDSEFVLSSFWSL